YLACGFHKYSWVSGRGADSIWINGSCPRPHRRRWPPRFDTGRRWPSRLVATASDEKWLCCSRSCLSKTPDRISERPPSRRSFLLRVVSTHARPAYRPIILEVVTGRPSAAAANPEILPLEFLLGDDPGSWIAEWMDRRVVREL